MSEPTPGLAMRWLECARIPLGFAGVFSAIAVASAGGRNSGTLARLGMPLIALVAFYVGAAAAIGWIVLLFGSWARTRSRAAFLGWATGTLCAVALNFMLPEPVRGIEAFVPAAAVGLILGLPAGALYWKRP